MPDFLDILPPCLLDAESDGHRHLWCVTVNPWHPAIRAGHARFRRASCRCGVTVISVFTWWSVDRAASEQFVDPTGLQREFLGVTGLAPAVPR